jgi:hypothetical protein
MVGLLNLLVGGALVAWIKQRPKMKELQGSAQDKLVDDLMGRVTKVEELLESQRKEYESRLEKEKMLHEAEIRIMRHRMNNLDQCLTMLLVLIEQDPAKAQAAAIKVREMRALQESREVLERSIMTGESLSKFQKEE